MLAVTRSIPFEGWQIALMVGIPLACLALVSYAHYQDYRRNYEAIPRWAAWVIAIFVWFFIGLLTPTVTHDGRLSDIQEDEHQVLLQEYEQSHDLDYEIDKVYASGWNGGEFSFTAEDWKGDCRVQYRVNDDGVTKTFFQDEPGGMRLPLTLLSAIDDGVKPSEYCHRT
ncbi:MAG TPA: hypothetical protein VK694_01055 [Verrucomicrobiae bacterium]|nr:hypothetical protein [Verrucomicrobiae bacterium]